MAKHRFRLGQKVQLTRDYPYRPAAAGDYRVVGQLPDNEGELRLAPNGKSALLAQKIWEENINAKGGLLGRPVTLIYYDDQSNPATVPAIYQKLLDVDKVDIIIGGYGTNLLAAAMPVVIQKQKMLIGLFGLAVNAEFTYPKYFSMIPLGPTPKSAQTKGFFDIAIAQNPKPQTVAIVAADAQFPINGSEGARENAKAAGLKIVYDKRYPPATTDLAPVVRAIQAANPDIVAIFSYPPDSVGMVRAVNEIGYKRWQKLYGRPAPKTFRRNLLVRGVAYQMQVKVHGGLSTATKRRLREIAQAVRTGNEETVMAGPRIKPGTRLYRSWNDTTHSVTVLPDGFEWRGVRYGSLSSVAMAITGTHWNGYAFFGLKRRPAKNKNAQKPREAADA